MKLEQNMKNHEAAKKLPPLDHLNKSFDEYNQENLQDKNDLMF